MLSVIYTNEVCEAKGIRHNFEAPFMILWLIKSKFILKQGPQRGLSKNAV